LPEIVLRQIVLRLLRKLLLLRLHHWLRLLLGLRLPWHLSRHHHSRPRQAIAGHRSHARDRALGRRHRLTPLHRLTWLWLRATQALREYVLHR
jgi:hypothetical protein